METLDKLTEHILSKSAHELINFEVNAYLVRGDCDAVVERHGADHDVVGALIGDAIAFFGSRKWAQ